MIRTIAAAAVRERLLAGGEMALLDVREQGVHFRGHPFFACSLPASRLELMVGDLVPRLVAPLVLLDGGGEGLAEHAADTLARLGYRDIAILEDGCAGWRASGRELFSGVTRLSRLGSGAGRADPARSYDPVPRLRLKAGSAG